MRSHIKRTLLLIGLLTLLHGCATGPLPRETESSAGRAPEFAGDGRAVGREPLAGPGEAAPYRTLTEIEALAATTVRYDTDRALEILQALDWWPSRQLASMIGSGALDPAFTEWLELALLVRTTAVGDEPVGPAATEWADFHYGHVVTQKHFRELVARYKARQRPPFRIAVLLPAEGSLAVAARTIRDGILGAYLEQPRGSILQFYDSGETTDAALSAYADAIADGADHVIGPLRVESTRALAGAGNLPVPLLLLNDSSPDAGDGPTPRMVSSLSLSQTQEAAAIATRAKAQGYDEAILLVPDDGWGHRMEMAFRESFEDEDRVVVDVSRFSRARNDHAAKLTEILKIEESNERKAQLQVLLGVPLTFEATHRDDFDFIFMATTPEEGRELKPLLRFHDVDDVQVFAMGRVFSGRLATAPDRDLDGVVFPTTPWQLGVVNGNTATPTSVRNGSFGNLYALGQDAWRLLTWLPLMQRDPDLWFAGATGRLRLQPNGLFYRDPAWATFSGGRPVTLEWPPLD